MSVVSGPQMSQQTANTSQSEVDNTPCSSFASGAIFAGPWDWYHAELGGTAEHLRSDQLDRAL